MAELVSRGHNINEPNDDSEYLLHSRGGAISVEQMDFLFSLGADINGRDKKGQTLLCRLVRYGNMDAIGRILEQSGLDITARDRDQQNALHATTACPQEVIESVIERLLAVPGIEVNAENDHGRTPLMLLMQWGFKRGVRKLPACPFAKVTGGRTKIRESPLMSAVQQGWSDEVLRRIQRLDSVDCYSDKCGATILHWAIFMNMKDVLNSALRKQTELVNKADDRGMTPLHYTAKDGDLEAGNSLLANGASITSRNANSGATPCHLAAASGHQRVLQRLLESTPASILNQRDRSGWTAMHWALTSGNDNLALFLLSQPEVNLTIGDKMDRQPILFTAGFASVNILQAFIESPPRPSTQ